MAQYCDNFRFRDSDNDSFEFWNGLRGPYFVPHLSADGVLSWTNTGSLPNPTPVDIKGTDGKSAYQAAVEAGFTGTEAEFNAYLSGIGDLAQEVADQKSAIEDLEALTNRKAGMLVDTASGAIASFVPDATIPDLLGVSVAVEPVQAGSGDPSPDNVRPISGWNAVEVQTTGVNILPFPYAETSLSRFGITYTVNDDGTITANGTATADSWFVLCNAWPYTADRITERTIRLSGCPAGGSASTYLIRSVITGHNDVGNGVNINNFRASYFRFQIQIKSGTTVNNLVFKPMVVIGTAVEDYHPYAGNRYTIQLGQTVYGAKLTIAEDGSVNALVDRAKTTVGALSWSLYNTAFYTSIQMGTSERPISPQYKSEPNVSSMGDASGWADYSIRAHTSGTYVYVKDTRYSTAAAFKTAEADTEIVYELATPITITLDPVTISTISGQPNNVWADAGDVSVEYAADLKHYIDSKIAAAVAALS